MATILSASRIRSAMHAPLPMPSRPVICGDARKITDRRHTLHDSAIALVEDSAIAADAPSPSGFEPHYQIALPYLGLFGYAVGRKTALLDANRTLFITPGREFADSQPVAWAGHASVLINPSIGVLEEICQTHQPMHHGAFQDLTRPASARARVLTHWLLALDPDRSNALRGDELTIEALREVLSPTQSAGRADATRIVDRAKQFLHAHGHERLGLREIAQQVGVSSVYLTQEFTRSEGMPLYRYQMRLRMSRALVELPHCEDITGLAIDLGFSSHSHFSATFKAMFGATPSDIRAAGQPN